MRSAKVACKIREQIRQFSREVSVGLSKTAARMVREVIYGVQSRGSVRLSEIIRALEEGIELKKVVESVESATESKGAEGAGKRESAEVSSASGGGPRRCGCWT